MKTLFTFFLLFLIHNRVAIAQKKENHAIEYLRDAHSNLTIDSLLKKEAAFNLIKIPNQSFGHDNVPHWFKIVLNNKNDETQKKLVEVDYAYLDEVTFFVVENGQLTYKSPTIGWQTPYENRLIKHYNPIFPVNLGPQSTKTIYLRVFRQTLTITAPIKIWNEEDFYGNEINRKFFWGGFGGILLFACLLGLILFVALRQTTYLYFALYVFTALIYLFMNKGLFLSHYQDGFLGISGKNIRQLFLNLEILFVLLFVREYIFPNFQFPLILKIIFRLCILLNLIAISLLLAEKYYFNTQSALSPYVIFLFPVAFLLPILLSFYLVFYSLINKIDALASRIYLIGITPLVIVSTLSIPRNFGIIPNHWLLETEGTMLFFLFDILVLSAGIGIRYKNLRDEKEQQQRLVYDEKLKLLHERENISRDLHDNVGSQLSVIASNLDNIGFLAEKRKLSPEKIETVNEFVREAIQSLRDTIWATNQETFLLTEFRARVQQYIHKYYHSLENCQIIVNFEEYDISLGSSQALNLFRIIQEALNNAVKYAKSSHISINLKIVQDHFILDIIDNGVGFNVENKETEARFGLINMQKRVNEIDGKLEIQSKFGVGTNIRVTV